MDYDGEPQAAPDITPRGVTVLDAHGCPSARYYLDVFPPAPAAVRTQGPAQPQPPIQPNRCDRPGALQSGALRGATGCTDRSAPSSRIRKHRLRRGRLTLSGTSVDRGCRKRVSRVTVTIGRRVKRGRCRFLQPNGRLGRARSCRRGVQLAARGSSRWHLSARARGLPRGTYVALARGVDTAGNVERARRRGPNVAKLRPRR
jgi:hypothetical protein